MRATSPLPAEVSSMVANLSIALSLHWNETLCPVYLRYLEEITVFQKNINQTESLKKSDCWSAALSKPTDAEAVLEINRIV
jgi:hypothetical protein